MRDPSARSRRLNHFNRVLCEPVSGAVLWHAMWTCRKAAKACTPADAQSQRPPTSQTSGSTHLDSNVDDCWRYVSILMGGQIDDVGQCQMQRKSASDHAES